MPVRRRKREITGEGVVLPNYFSCLESPTVVNGIIEEMLPKRYPHINCEPGLHLGSKCRWQILGCVPEQGSSQLLCSSALCRPTLLPGNWTQSLREMTENLNYYTGCLNQNVTSSMAMTAPLALARTSWDSSFTRTRPVLSEVKPKQLSPANAKCYNWIPLIDSYILSVCPPSEWIYPCWVQPPRCHP